MKQTKEMYCFEILHNITKNVDVTDLKLVTANFTAEGLTSVVEDSYNGMKYTITITPVK